MFLGYLLGWFSYTMTQTIKQDGRREEKQRTRVGTRTRVKPRQSKNRNNSNRQKQDRATVRVSYISGGLAWRSNKLEQLAYGMVK